MTPKVLVLMGSGSDSDTVNPTVEILQDFGVEVRMEVTSAHRSPERNLAGVAASHTTLPVIGVPLDISPLGGLDSLLSTVMMPAGIPVAVVTVGKVGSKNAAYLALSILSIKHEGIKKSLHSFRKKMERDVIESSRALNDKSTP
jgi:phosphoribosylcarboxyaminoimidazole (NCAIR) mutase